MKTKCSMRKFAKKYWIIILSILLLTVVIVGALLTARTTSGEKTESLKASEIEKPDKIIETMSETTAIPFETTYQDDATLAKGATKVIAEGVDGEKITTYQVEYDPDGKEVSREEIKNEVTKNPVSKIIANGTYVAPARTTQAATTQSEPAQDTDLRGIYLFTCNDGSTKKQFADPSAHDITKLPFHPCGNIGVKNYELAQ